MENISLMQADITTLKVDAIVNAANASLCGGGGVDGAIHRAAGKELLAECRTLNGCNTGFAKITAGYNLPARHIIHTVGPVWYGGHRNEPQLLASCYRECLKIAVANQISSIAFPAISCGAYRFPVDKACDIAVGEVSRFLSQNSTDLDVIFVAFGEHLQQVLSRAFSTYGISAENKST
ncbi:O-acetyl-ADP-ribose deacetylase [Aliikangiella coralliicola]|uniref:O-acetyl-ADP-ribose deacetylase n=1 Tax=Aliikangiella coralliicola TaxID=2592383 RepID=A0A545UEW1_9GAMM|nr:O-acetyl-ADP-ribose deacetylase [Aliikangiella coralliicola]TQV88022.1 O-acetyl-ADP-ribose deacetylase [Aliikangiella coralliicola]